MAKFAMPISILGLALAIAYFGYALISVVSILPTSLQSIEDTAESISLLEDEIETISEQVPSILEEFEAIRMLVPDLLEESAMIRANTLVVQKELEAYRQLLPSVLEESANVRKDMLVVEDEMEDYRKVLPDIIGETTEIRNQVDSMQAELAAYRQMMPDILREIEASRKMIPPTLDRVDGMIADASDAGKRASEGAVAGVFSGVFKAPLAVFSSVLPTKDSSDGPYVTEAAMKIIKDQDLDGVVNWRNKKTGTVGSVTLLESLVIEEKDCRRLSIVGERNGKTAYERLINICETPSGEWVQYGSIQK